MPYIKIRTLVMDACDHHISLEVHCPVVITKGDAIIAGYVTREYDLLKIVTG